MHHATFTIFRKRINHFIRLQFLFFIYDIITQMFHKRFFIIPVFRHF